MKIITDILEWQSVRKQLSVNTLGFVPTMGNLHQGHLSLCERAKKENDLTVVSIFINPTQFNEQQDFNLYPRTLDQDVGLLKNAGIDFLLTPSSQEIYHDNYQVQVTENTLSTELEGAYRPGHFTGMLTIVLKLLNLAGAANAYFGEKDFQQLLLVKKMVNSLFIPTNVIACPTIRANDGLALSSRNSRLTCEQRNVASYFPHFLQSNLSLENIAVKLNEQGFKVDYIVEKWQRRLGAVWLGDIRLIDNFPLTY